jgi:putative secretion ATPase (PEP-CTERM system associated)
MYTSFYKFSGNPFQMTPDSRFYFESDVHRRAMAYLLFGLEQAEGFIILTGDVGAGKTTILSHLLERLDPSAYVTAKIVSTHLQSDDMLRAIAAGFNLPFQGLDKATLLNRIENFLVSTFNRGLRTLLLVDEAQNMPPAALEELRMLSNFQVGPHAPLQGILMAQPQFRRLLANPDLEQFRQRIIASHHLGPIGVAETRDYIRYRLSVVGWTNDPEISEEAYGDIFENTSGVPRKINTFCNRLMLFCFLDELHHIDREAVRAVAEDLVRERGQSIEEAGTQVSAGVMHQAAQLDEMSNGDVGHRLTRLERAVTTHGQKIKTFSALQVLLERGQTELVWRKRP